MHTPPRSFHDPSRSSEWANLPPPLHRDSAIPCVGCIYEATPVLQGTQAGAHGAR